MNQFGFNAYLKEQRAGKSYHYKNAMQYIDDPDNKTFIPSEGSLGGMTRYQATR